MVPPSTPQRAPLALGGRRGHELEGLLGPACQSRFQSGSLSSSTSSVSGPILATYPIDHPAEAFAPAVDEHTALHQRSFEIPAEMQARAAELMDALGSRSQSPAYTGQQVPLHGAADLRARRSRSREKRPQDVVIATLLMIRPNAGPIKVTITGLRHQTTGRARLLFPE